MKGSKKGSILLVLMLGFLCIIPGVIDAHMNMNANTNACIDANACINTNIDTCVSPSITRVTFTDFNNFINNSKNQNQLSMQPAAPKIVEEEPEPKSGDGIIITVSTRRPRPKPEPKQKEEEDPEYIVGDFRGRIYNIGTSITNGFIFHDAYHGRISNCEQDGFFNYYFDKKMYNDYGVLTDTSDWYRNMSYAVSWDKYNFGTGGFLNEHTKANGEDPFPLGSQAEGRGMCLDCPDDLINGTWGRGLWRLKNVDWNGKFVIVEGGHHDQNVLFEGENATGMGEDIQQLYEQSRYFNYTLVLLGHLPVGNNTNQYPEIIAATNQWREDFANNHSDMVFVDFRDSCFYKDDGSANESFYYEPDNKEVHLNKAGVKILGEMIAEAVYGFMLENNLLDEYI